MSLKCETYQYYEQYSSSYIINIDSLDTCKSVNEIDVETWITDNCYSILTSQIMPDFLTKIQHNLQLAKSRQDHEYVKYISQKLKIEVTPNWEYRPNKLKLILKVPSASNGGTQVTRELSSILDLPPDKRFKSRGELVHLVHKYIYDNQLQNRYDKKVITPDDKLQECLTPLSPAEREYTYVNLSLHLKLGI